MSFPPYAIAVIIDNSDTSIDGDFKPNRLEAQKTAIDHLSQYYLAANQESQFGINTMGSGDFGIRSSFTSNYQKIIMSMEKIKSCGFLRFEKALRNALLNLKHCSEKTEEKKVLAFVGSNHDIDSPVIVKRIVQMFKREDVSLVIVIIGKSVPNVPFLKKMCREIPKSSMIEVRECDTILSDKLIMSDMRPDKKSSRCAKEFCASDPNCIRAMEMSEILAKKVTKEPETKNESDSNQKTAESKSEKATKPKKRRKSKKSL